MPASSHRSGRSVVGTGLHLLGWLIVAVLGSVVLARAIAWDRWRLYADVDAAIEVLFLPAWVILIAAALRRRWPLAVAAALICLAQIDYVAPEVLAAEPLPASIMHAPTLRLFDANVQQNNYSMAGYISQIRAYHPDVVTIEESAPDDLAQFEASGVFASLPYRFSIQCCGSRGFIVASRFPLGHVSVSYVNGLAYLLRSTLQLPTRRIDFWIVHTTAPVNPDWNDWNLELDGVYAALVHDHPRPLLMDGDFNATWGNREFRAILSTGLTDAAPARGHPFDFTWSQLLPLLPPLVRIDHVLSAGGVTVTTISTHAGPGSEHRDITATVAVPNG
jgi:endonuclease/exonuclease/phosphatase (EEP) superfamily protein YafD